MDSNTCFVGKFKKILVPLDGSLNSLKGLDAAIEIADGLDSEIIGFHVFELPFVKGFKYTKKIKDEIKEKALNAIRPAISRAEQANVKFKHRTGYGNAGSEIVKFAQKENFNMIVMGARGVGDSKEVFLGGTSNYVLHKTKIPVLIIK